MPQFMTPSSREYEELRQHRDQLQDRCDGMSAAFETLYGTLVTFNEHKQEFFCTVCRYRDPLGPDGRKLHDDNCPVLEMAKAVEVKP